MDLTIILLLLLLLISVIASIFNNFQMVKKIESNNKLHSKFLESIEKYVEIFNEQNVHKLLEKSNTENEDLAIRKIDDVREDFRKKLINKNTSLTDEQEILIDFVTLSLSLLMKIPPRLRERVIDENTNNPQIRELLKSKLDSIEEHYLPISLLEVAIAKENSN